MADGLGCGVNSVVGAWHHLHALQVSFDRTKREAQLPQNKELADSKMCIMARAGLGWAGLGLELVMMAARRRFSLLRKRGIINFYSREAVA